MSKSVWVGDYGYRREIDGLRALAVLPVVLYHAEYELFRGGFVGVDVFFVISGYLITRLICRELNLGVFSVRYFLERRARRIVPALVVVMVVSVPFAWLWLLPPEFQSYTRSLAAITIVASNFLFWRESGYFDQAAELKPFLHTWSLAVEEQFYLLFPILFSFLWRIARSWTVVSCAAAAIGSFGLACWVETTAPVATFYLLPFRVWELLFGALVALYLLDRQTRLDSRANEIGAIVGVAAILYAVVGFNSEDSPYVVHLLLPVVGTALVIVCAIPSTAVGRVLASKPLVAVGVISYSAYLWHHALFALARNSRLLDLSSWITLVLIALTFGLAFVTQRVVEMPFRDIAKVSRKTFLGLVGFAFCGLIVFDFISANRDGFPFRVRNDVLRENFTFLPAEQGLHDERCQTRFPQFSDAYSCLMSQEDSPSILLVGDSHALHYVRALSESLPTESILSLVYLGCIPFSGSEVAHDDDECGRQISKVYALAKSESSIRTVILAGYWKYLASGTFETEGQPRLASDVRPEQGQELLGRGIAAVESLQGAGRRVIIMDDNPEMDFDVRNCADLIFETRGVSESPCVVSRESHERRRSSYVSYLRAIARRTQTVLIDPTDVLCDEENCFAGRNNEIYYYDSDHLSKTGSRLVVDRLLRPILSQ